MKYIIMNNKFFISLKGKNYSLTSIWILASAHDDKWFLISHGTEKNINDMYDLYVQKYNDAGLLDEIKELFILDITEFGLDEINKAVNIPNYVGNLINANNLLKVVKKYLQI